MTSNTKFLFDLKKRDSRVLRPNTEQHPGAISKREQAYSIGLLKSAEFEKNRQPILSQISKFTNGVQHFASVHKRKREGV